MKFCIRLKSLATKNFQSITVISVVVVLLAVDVIQTQRIKNYQDEITIRDTIIKKITFSAQKLEFLENSLYRTILFDHTKMTGYELTDTTVK